MRRRLIQLGLCLLLGAVVNVVVAWWCALMSPISMSTGVGRELFNQYVETWSTVTTGLYLEASDSADVSAGKPGTPTGAHLRYTAGLPMWSLRGERDVMNRSARSTLICPAWSREPLPTTARAFLDAPRMRQRLLPVAPIPLGFAVNSAVYGAAIACVFFAGVGARALARARRRAMGRCVQCAYELRGFAVCPECGAPAQVRA